MRGSSVAVLLGAIACRTPAPPPAPVPVAAPAVATGSASAEVPVASPTLRYAGFVTPGARWTFQLHTDENDRVIPDDVVFDAGDPRADCWVEEVVDIPGGRAASVWCDEAFDGSRNPVSGDWAVTAAGLFEKDYDGALELFLPAAPIAREDVTPDEPSAEVTEDRTQTERIEERDDAWCTSRSHDSTFGSGTRLCADATGPVSGRWYYEDLTTIYSTFFRRVDHGAL